MDSSKTYAPTLSDLANTELRSLRQSGIEPTWEMVAKIHELTQAIAKPIRNSVTLTGTPKKLGSIWLWPFTIASAEWFDWASTTLPDEYSLAACIYAMHKAREPGAFDYLYDEAEAQRILQRFQKGLNVTAQEAIEACGIVSNASDELKEHEPAADYSDCIARLVALTNTDPEIWKSRVCLDYITKQIDAINAVNDAGGHAPLNEYIQAERALGMYLLHVRREHGAN